MVVRAGFEPAKPFGVGFTDRFLWPLEYLTDIRTREREGGLELGRTQFRACFMTSSLDEVL